MFDGHLIFEWALKMLMKKLAQEVTPEKIERLKAVLLALLTKFAEDRAVELVAFLRKLAKEETPDFKVDDELVEIVAKILGVP